MSESSFKRNKKDRISPVLADKLDYFRRPGRSL